MTPREKYGAEFYYKPMISKRADGREFHWHEVSVCISQAKDKESTLMFGWAVVRELAQWISDSLPTVLDEENFRITVAWSRSVRQQQGHIFKIIGKKEHVRKIVDCTTYQDYTGRHGGHGTPMPNWEKDVFKPNI